MLLFERAIDWQTGYSRLFVGNPEGYAGTGFVVGRGLIDHWFRKL
jgi:hypothetical protein